MKTNCAKLLFAAALLILIGGSSLASTTHEAQRACDGMTYATPPVKPTKRDSTKTKKQKTKKSKKQRTKTHVQTTTLL